MEEIISQNWDLDRLYFGGIHHDQVKEKMILLNDEINELLKKVQAYNASNGRGNIDRLSEILQEVQQVMSTWEELDDFLICLQSEDVTNVNMSNLMSFCSEIKVDLMSVQGELDQSLLNLSEQSWQNFIQQESIEPIRFYLEEKNNAAKSRLSLEIENIISALSINGFTAWEDHYEQLINQVKIPLQVNGEEELVPYGQALHQSMFSNERRVRQQAAESVQKVFGKSADSFSSILNAIAGYRLKMYEQRGWPMLKETLNQNRISEESLHMMVSTIKQHHNMVGKFIKRKSMIDKLEDIAWYDMNIPSFTSDKQITYEEAKRLIIAQFHQFSPKLGEFAKNAFEAGWIEAEDRPNKAVQGFCASMPLSKESRVFYTFRGTYQDVVILAHELGHAYHNVILHEEPPFAQEKGTSVAETASTFMENFVLDAAIDQTKTRKEKLTLLEMKILNGLTYVATVPAMFEFEVKLYEKRKIGFVTTEEIKALMLQLENDVYGGQIKEIDLYKWIYIQHFYSTEKAFYNIPYTIGYLFSNGIYMMAKEKGSLFQKQFDHLLRNTGRMTVEQLASAYLNKDLNKKDFWETSLKPLEEAIEEYLVLTEEMI
ncbi:M3 family oligoendopeptidase [Bacillus spongiae]|uniref:M3 family oligoendopeptidase n=1 Tax=Bacillus spongiae TaxID=2683610 RepID=A0ABU8HEE4_9BACI